MHSIHSLTGSLGSCQHPRRQGFACVSALALGVITLGLVKLTDAVTTILGLTKVPGAVEQNPLTATLIATFGLVPGLVVMIVGSLVSVTLITELGGAIMSGPADRGGLRRLMRFTGFGAATVVSLVPVISNTLILLEHGILF